jgi:L-threonate 2-dehydrogenase
MRVGIVAAGAMGSGIARRLTEHGAEVWTALAGRGAATQARARAAGMLDVGDARLAEVDILLSIVPPGVAVELAERLAPHLLRAAREPLYVDCNAVSPATAARIGAITGAAGARFVDAGIIGLPPQAAAAGPNLYVCGAHGAEARALARFGLEIRLLEGPIGSASALKMCYGGTTKGLIAVAVSMLLAAERAGVAQALHAEFEESQPGLLASLERTVPGMFSKAYRWIAEMREIAAFAAADPAAAAIFSGVARAYEQMAADAAGAHERCDLLSAFLERRRRGSHSAA